MCIYDSSFNDTLMDVNINLILAQVRVLFKKSPMSIKIIEGYRYMQSLKITD